MCIHNQDGTDATVYKRNQTLFDDDVMNKCEHFVFTQCTYVPTFDGQNAFVDDNVSHHQSLAFLPEHDPNENGNDGGSDTNDAKKNDVENNVNDEEINANDDKTDDHDQEDDNASENEIKITNFRCAAQDSCIHDHKEALMEKHLTLTSRNVNPCQVCNHCTHKECTTRWQGSTKMVRHRGGHFMCHLCKLNEDGEHWPFVASKKFKDVVSDKAAQQLTIKALAFDSEENCEMMFQEMMGRTK